MLGMNRGRRGWRARVVVSRWKMRLALPMLSTSDKFPKALTTVGSLDADLGTSWAGLA